MPLHSEIFGFASDFRMKRHEFKLNFISCSSEGRVYKLVYSAHGFSGVRGGINLNKNKNK
jgi:hypothetical protein